MKVKILIATIVILAVLPSIFAGRKRGKGNRRRQGNGEDAGCGEWELAECVPKKGSCGKGKQLATRSGDSCRKTEKQMRCTVPCEGEDNCRYKKGPDSVWSECDGDNMMSMERVLKDPAQADCAPTKTFQRPCKQRKVKQGKKAGCKYARGEWSDCVEGKKTRVDTLKKERGEAECPAERTKERRCSAGSA